MLEREIYGWWVDHHDLALHHLKMWLYWPRKRKKVQLVFTQENDHLRAVLRRQDVERFRLVPLVKLFHLLDHGGQSCVVGGSLVGLDPVDELKPIKVRLVRLGAVHQLLGLVGFWLVHSWPGFTSIEKLFLIYQMYSKMKRKRTTIGSSNKIYTPGISEPSSKFYQYAKL